MSTIAEQLKDAADKASKSSAQAGLWATGPVGTTVPTDSGNVPTIAEFTRAAQERADDAIDALGWVMAGDFTAGRTVTVRNQYVLVVGGAGYRWDGALPKVVAPGSSPTPIATGAWMLTNPSVITMPTPDVSIPFTTDGRMTHGKGAPVLVGTTPVAQLVTYERLGSQTMIDKSGRLVTVPAGEMAIEQQGLAIFDQSVNLAAPSINWPASANAAAAWNHGAADAAGWITVSGAGDTGATEGSYKNIGLLVKDTPYTFSMDVLKTPGLNLRLRSYGATTNIDVSLTETTATGAGASEAVTDMGSYWRVEVTRTFVNDTTRILRIYPFGTSVGATGSMTYRRVQLEAKPFATPYIENATSAQTTRPATTRCDFPWLGNMQPLTNWQELTIAFEFDTAGVPASPASHTILAQGGGVAQNLLARVEHNGFLRFYRSAGATHQPTPVARRRYKMCYRINRNACDLFIDGVRVGGSITAAPLTPGLNDMLRLGYSQTPDRCLNGHLRNINVWNSSLTDIQCQAATS